MKKRIDSSDQDEDASFEELNDDDLKSSSGQSGKNLNQMYRNNKNDSIEDRIPRNMMLANSSVQEEEENYSSDQISPDVSIVKSDMKNMNMVPDSEYQDVEDQYSDDYSDENSKEGRESSLMKSNLERMQKSLKETEKPSQNLVKNKAGKTLSKQK